ncbi:Na+/H+ antiporter subunit C [Parasulfuritortus cantonensis]|uniref:Na+/H+ antiporter subunit C n=2 Tax=Parasulfuritortus cantonensis TaxID=2528202 RepID=A0A4R1BN19_9PROT|nr:Na+/H+ antiporter subunit C [Parasulfuritortus cantonensis]
MTFAPDPLALLVIGALGLIVVGAAGLAFGRHLFRLVLALGLAEAGANLLLVIAGYRWDAVAPILTGSAPAAMVDPVPQALVLTAIVIGVGVQALAVALLVRVKLAYGTLDLAELKALVERDIRAAAGIGEPDSAQAPATLPGPAGLIGERP